MRPVEIRTAYMRVGGDERKPGLSERVARKKADGRMDLRKPEIAESDMAFRVKQKILWENDECQHSSGRKVKGSQGK